MGLNYNHLRYFREVAHEGNLTRAAERLSVSQSALSIQIRKLEERLGHALFEREGRGLVLTEAGRIALDHADAIFRTGDDLVATLDQRREGRQVLSVGALATLSRNFQLAFLRDLIGRDDVEVMIRSGGLAELLAGLDAHRLDVVLANAPPPDEAGRPRIAHRIDSQPVSLVGTPERLRAERGLARLLAREPLVVPVAGTAIRTGLDALADRMGITLQIAAEVDDMAMLRLLAREDAGLAVVPPIVVRDELAARILVEAAQIPGLEEGFYAVTLPRRFPNPLLRGLIPAAA